MAAELHCAAGRNVSTQRDVSQRLRVGRQKTDGTAHRVDSGRVHYAGHYRRGNRRQLDVARRAAAATNASHFRLSISGRAGARRCQRPLRQRVQDLDQTGTQPT